MFSIANYQRNANSKYHLTPRMAIINKSTNKNCWRGVKKRKPSFPVGRIVNWYNHYGKQYGGSSEN